MPNPDDIDEPPKWLSRAVYNISVLDLAAKNEYPLPPDSLKSVFDFMCALEADTMPMPELVRLKSGYLVSWSEGTRWIDLEFYQDVSMQYRNGQGPVNRKRKTSFSSEWSKPLIHIQGVRSWLAKMYDEYAATTWAEMMAYDDLPRIPE